MFGVRDRLAAMTAPHPYFSGGLTRPAIAAATIAALRACESPLFVEAMLARVSGVGLFEWSPTNGVADDGVSIICPTDIPAFRLGRWLLFSYTTGLLVGQITNGEVAATGATAGKIFTSGLPTAGGAWLNDLNVQPGAISAAFTNPTWDTGSGTFSWGTTLVQFKTGLVDPKITMARAANDTAAPVLWLQGAQAGVVVAVNGKTSGTVQVIGGPGPDSAGGNKAGNGGAVGIYGGPAGVGVGALGANGASVYCSGGAGSGTGSHGKVSIATLATGGYHTSLVEIGNTTDNPPFMFNGSGAWTFPNNPTFNFGTNNITHGSAVWSTQINRLSVNVLKLTADVDQLEIGHKAATTMLGQVAESAVGFSGIAGTSQTSRVRLMGVGTNGGKVELTLDGNAPGAANRCVIQVGKACKFALSAEATCISGSDVGKHAGWTMHGSVSNGGSINLDYAPFNLTSAGTFSAIAYTPEGASGGDAGMLAMLLSPSTDLANSCFVLDFTGKPDAAFPVSSNGWLVVATVEFTEAMNPPLS